MTLIVTRILLFAHIFVDVEGNEVGEPAFIFFALRRERKQHSSFLLPHFGFVEFVEQFNHTFIVIIFPMPGSAFVSTVTNTKEAPFSKH